MSAAVALEDWLAASAKSSKELVKTTLGCEQHAVVEKTESGNETQYGSFVEMLNVDYKVTVGIVTNRPGSQQITESLLGMQPMSEEDEADALGEIANILAGNMKTVMGSRVKPMQLGLPFYFKGRVHFKEPVEIACRHEKWGPAEVTVMVVQQRDHA